MFDAPWLSLILGRDLYAQSLSLGAGHATYSLEGIADAISSFTAEAGMQGCMLIGYSLGARLALAAAVRHEGLYQGVVSISGTAGLTGTQQRADRVAADTSVAEMLESAGVAAFVHDWYNKPMWQSLQRHARWVLSVSATPYVAWQHVKLLQ